MLVAEQAQRQSVPTVFRMEASFDLYKTSAVLVLRSSGFGDPNCRAWAQRRARLLLQATMKCGGHQQAQCATPKKLS